MKEINRIHLAKIPYEIEIDAKDELNKYFNALKKNIEDETILDDIEIRITEILRDQGVAAGGGRRFRHGQALVLQISLPGGHV